MFLIEVSLSKLLFWQHTCPIPWLSWSQFYTSLFAAQCRTPRCSFLCLPKALSQRTQGFEPGFCHVLVVIPEICWKSRNPTGFLHVSCSRKSPPGPSFSDRQSPESVLLPGTFRRHGDHRQLPERQHRRQRPSASPEAFFWSLTFTQLPSGALFSFLLGRMSL